MFRIDLKKRVEFSRLFFGWCLAAIAFFVSFSVTITGLATALLLASWLAEGQIKEKCLQLLERKLYLLFLLLYIIFVLAAFWTADSRQALKLLETKLTLLVVPFLVGAVNLSQKQINYIFSAFIAGVTIVTLTGFIYYFSDYSSVEAVKSTFVANRFRDLYSNYTNIHPTYISFYTVSAILLVLHLLRFYRSSMRWWHFCGSVFLIIYFLLLLLVLSSRMPQLAMLLVTVFFGIYYSVIYKKFLLLGATTFILALVVFVSLRTPVILNRFNEIRLTAFEPPKSIHHNSTNIRVAILLCSKEILEENWLYGVGTGDVQNQLNACYKANEYSEVLYLDNYGPHNVFLDAWLTAGISALLLHIAAFLLPCILALKRGDSLYAAFLMIFLLCSLTESLLSSNKGIVAYALLNSVMALNLYKKQPDIKYN